MKKADAKVVLFCFYINIVFAVLLYGAMLLFHCGYPLLISASCLVFGTGTSSAAAFMSLQAAEKYLRTGEV